MKTVFAIACSAILIILAALLHTSVKDFLWIHPWWHSSFVAVPAIVLTLFEVLHSREANTLQAEANQLRSALDSERNKHLQQIAANTQKPITQAERNAETLRKHVGAKVAVSEEHGSWSTAPEIAEVNDDNTVTLFTPSSYSSSSAWCVKVRCDDLEITNIPQGACPLQLKVIKRYGPTVPLGEITRWEERFQPAANPTFAKGTMACHAEYSKPGSSERRNVRVYASSDGANSFLLEASTGEALTGDNREISKKFMVLQVENDSAGFNRSTFAHAGSTYPLFIR